MKTIRNRPLRAVGNMPDYVLRACNRIKDLLIVTTIVHARSFNQPISKDQIQVIEKNSQQITPLDRLSFHVFQWLCHGGQVDVEALVKEAFDTPEECGDYWLGDGGVHDAVYPRLAQLIEEKLTEHLDDWACQVGDFFSAEECELFSDPDYPPEDQLDLAELFLPILCDGVRGVDTFGIAQAILRSHGHWKKQDRYRPDLLPPTPEQDRRE